MTLPHDGGIPNAEKCSPAALYKAILNIDAHVRKHVEDSPP